MDSARWRRVDELLAAALELPDAGRPAFLEKECGTDAALRADVESMLRASRQAQDFLEAPAVEVVTAALSAAPTEPRPPASARRPGEDVRFVPGDLVSGRYRIAGLLGRGGMGEVYRADDLKLGQPVALKFLAEPLSRDGAALARFHREVSLARQVAHRHVCRVYDIGEHAGMHFLSMEFVRGEELSSLLRRVGRLPGEKALEMARQLCAGLAAIHSAGVLHRDLKPANVMIDEHGDVRITDFGVAALAEAAVGRDTMAGTPVYMAPEQLSGGEVSVRSDVYALGLVLYEAFTGNRPFAAKTLEDVLKARLSDTAPTSPSTWVEGLDPIAERVILRCLEKDPAKRPAGAIEVAAALPGGDPLAAALAAGETPSPQMVAAAAPEHALRPAAALLLLGAIVAGIALAAAISGRISLHRIVALERSPELLRADAAEVSRLAGFITPAADTASAIELDSAALQYLLRGAAPQGGPGLPLVQFWFRRSPVPLVPLGNGAETTLRNPPNDVAGMLRMRLDMSGRLLLFEAAPPQVESEKMPRGPVGWDRFFERAGLSMGDFSPAPPAWTPPQHADVRAAWTGTWRGQPGVPLRIEAASLRGAPVWFELVFPWSQPQREPAAGAGDRLTLLLVTLYFGALGLGVLLAWRNLRAGRGDRRGAFRIAGAIFAARLVYWAFTAHHVAATDEVMIVIRGLQLALYGAVVVGILYLALEPFIRRRWPHGLISWSRLLAGEIRDPLVGRDLLAGGLLGIAAILSMSSFQLVPQLLGRPLARPAVHSTLLYEFGLQGARGFLPLLVNQFFASLMFPLILTSVVVFFTLLTRRLPAALGLTWALLFAATWLNFADGSGLSLLLSALLPSVLLFALTRFGLLTLAATFFYMHLTVFYPVTTEWTAWYATSFLMQAALLLALSLFAFRTSLGGQKVFRGELLEA